MHCKLNKLCLVRKWFVVSDLQGLANSNFNWHMGDLHVKRPDISDIILIGRLVARILNYVCLWADSGMHQGLMH
jgi:hypothetical protein